MVAIDVGESMTLYKNFQQWQCNKFCFFSSPMSDTDLVRSLENLLGIPILHRLSRMGKQAHISAALAEASGRPMAVQRREEERWPLPMRWCIPVITKLKVAWEEDNYSRQLTVPPAPNQSSAISCQLSSTKSTSIVTAPDRNIGAVMWQTRRMNPWGKYY